MPAIRVLNDITIITDYVEGLRNLLKQGTLTERRSLVKSFVKEVAVTDNEVSWIYTFPIMKASSQKGHQQVRSTI